MATDTAAMDTINVDCTRSGGWYLRIIFIILHGWNAYKSVVRGLYTMCTMYVRCMHYNLQLYGNDQGLERSEGEC
jgi:hypothetical protein